MNGTAYGHLAYLTQKEIGSVSIYPTGDVVVGTYGTYTLTYTVGIYGVDVGGSIKIGTRRMSDWGRPQFTDPSAPNYVTVACSAMATQLSVNYDPRGYIRPFRAVITVYVEKGALYPGDRIMVTLGDRSGGSPGIMAQSFPETDCLFAVFVDAMSGGVWAPVPRTSLPLRVITGPAIGIQIQGPSQVMAGEPFRVKVNGYDLFGNPTPTAEKNLRIEAQSPIDLYLEPADGRSKWINGVTLASPGVQHVSLFRNGKIIARSNPILVKTAETDFMLYWGDTQAQTASTVGTGSVQEYYTYARDVAGIDFCTHQANDFMVHDKVWEENCLETKNFHKPGRFVSILGWEWSGTAAAGGDRNVLFSGDNAPIFRSNSWHLPTGDPENERPTAADLHRSIKKYVEKSGSRVVLIPHVGGRRVDMNSVEPELEPVFEICSCHGIFEWWLFEALAKGLRIGIVGASDDHTCRPGLAFPSTPEMAIRGGLAAVYAKELTREGILDALSARRCYGTTGERILAWIEVDGHPMGAAFSTRKLPKISVHLAGTAPLAEVSLFNGKHEVFKVHPNPLKRNPNRIRFIWTGAEGRDRNRYTVWDGKMTLTQGRFLSVQPLNMYAPKERVILKGSKEICWTSITAGHQVGILVELDAPDDAKIFFETRPATFDFQIKSAQSEDLFIDAGGVEKSVSVSTLHCEGDKQETRFDFVEEDLKPGVHAYWLRVVQQDFHRAWTSPIYVDLKPS